MIIRNYLKSPLAKEVIHEGVGLCEHCAVFMENDFETPLRFLNYTVVPQGASFGQHKHNDDNEIYIVLHGNGEYIENGETVCVHDGDIIVNARFATHGIRNTGTDSMQLLVLEAYNPQ